MSIHTEDFKKYKNEIDKFVYKQLPFVNPKDIHILEELYTITCFERKVEVPIVMARTPNYAVFMWVFLPLINHIKSQSD